jgi:hypothetical protein
MIPMDTAVKKIDLKAGISEILTGAKVTMITPKVVMAHVDAELQHEQIVKLVFLGKTQIKRSGAGVTITVSAHEQKP